MHAPVDHPAPPGGDEDADWLVDNAAADVVLTPEGVLIEYNRAAAHMFRLPPGVDARGMNVLSLCTDVPRFHGAIRALEQAGRLENWDCDFLRFDNSTLHGIINLIGNFDGNRRLVSVRANLFNITEWKKLQQRSVDSDRLDAIGRLAGGVAHDFNNLLMIISGHADKLSAHADPAVAHSALAIREAAGRASTVTRQLLAFGRREVLRAQIVDLNSLVVSIQADIRRFHGRSVQVDLALERSLWQVKVDPTHFEQALSTLANHAIDTMAPTWTLRLSTRNVEVSQSGAPHPGVSAGAYVQIDITHAGRPFDADMRARLFEPFDDPVPQSRMGLAAVYGVITQSGGFVWVDEAPPDATVYTILVPVLRLWR